MLEVRDLRFDVAQDVPKFWHGRGRAVSIFFDSLSICFPAGERFFIASVRKHRQHARDELARQVALFYQQEGIHSREHVEYNRRLKRDGYPIDQLEAQVEAILALARRVLPARSQLAATCALEHFTGMMALILLGEPQNLEGAHPKMAALWEWHAAEESEHKTVPFDVFRAAGGTEAERLSIMVLAAVIFWAKVLQHQAVMMNEANCLYSLDEWRSLVRFLFVHPGSMRKVARDFLRYFNPGFHPRDIDDGALLEAWKKRAA